MTNEFVIIEPDPVVGMDIEGMLIAAFPTCRMNLGASLSEIGAAIYNVGPDSTLFVRSTLVLENAVLGNLLVTVAARGCRIVIVGEKQELGFPATFLQLPFSTEMVIEALAQQDDGRAALY